jgi:S-methylmethionine-dependent homocysteine/selenocysteine methylase
MTTTPAVRLPQFITDGGIETHIIFNMGVDLPHFSAFPLNDSTAGREVIRRYYRDYLPVARAAGRSFLFATDSWRASPDWADRLGYDRGLLKQNNVTSAAICAELADEFAAAGVASAIAGISPRCDAWQYDASMTVAEAHDGLANVLNSQASRLFSISDGGMEFDMPNGPTGRETSRKDTGDAVTIGLVLAAVVATLVLFGPVLLKSDEKSMDVVATQPTYSPIKTP